MTNTHPSALLQARVYAILAADATLMALIEDVYDNVPDNSEFPYVVIGDTTFAGWSSRTHQGFEVELSVNTYTQSRGKLEAQGIMNRIYTLLHQTDLAVTGFPTVVCQETLHQVSIGADNRTYNGTQRFRILLGGNNV